MKEFKVNVAPMIKRLELISKKRLAGFLTGEFKSVFRGRGLEFHGYRKYNPAEDDAKQIDWKASLRSRYLVVKELVEERNNNVMFLIDVSSSMSFASGPQLKNEYVIELFASLSHALLAEGDSVGVAIFSEKIRRFVRSNIGSKQLYIMLHELTEPRNYEGQLRLGESLREFNALLTRPAIVIIISDFLQIQDNWIDYMKLLNAKHEVICIVVNDPRDISMPAETGDIMLQDPSTGETLLVNTKAIKEDYERAALENKNALIKTFKDHFVDYLFITTDQPFSKVLYMFFKRRAMQAIGG
ncbi:TPA: DUF58 domain-containing protein [Candidatus Woesearchaeota archaeon]|nr:DUF58 domain-containing protein [Candidatus Woesearchaeota archaeon]